MYNSGNTFATSVRNGKGDVQRLRQRECRSGRFGSSGRLVYFLTENQRAGSHWPIQPKSDQPAGNVAEDDPANIFCRLPGLPMPKVRPKWSKT